MSTDTLNDMINKCYAANDVESLKNIMYSIEFGKLFLDPDTYYLYKYEMNKIIKRIVLFNNIELLDMILQLSNEYIDIDKQQDIGNFIVAMLYSYDFDSTAEIIIENYNLYFGTIIVLMYENLYIPGNKICSLISKKPEYIQNEHTRLWMIKYSARRDDIEMIKFLKQYYQYTTKEIFDMLFNYSKSYIGSEKLYEYIFDNYFDMINDDKESFFLLIKELFWSEHLRLIYFILNKIEFNEQELIRILTFIFNYPPFFNKVVTDVSNILLNTWHFNTNDLKKLYSQIDNETLFAYIQKELVN